MKPLHLTLSLIAVAIALPTAARSQVARSSDSPFAHVLEIDGKRAVLSGEIRLIDSPTMLDRQLVQGRRTGVRQSYEAELSVTSVTPILSEFFSGKSPSPQSGLVYGLDAEGTVQTIRSFTNFLITEARFPVLDARSPSTGRVTIRFEAEAATDTKAPLRIEIKAPKDWQSSNFRIQIGQLPCQRVVKVDALTVRRTTSTPTGATRTPQTSSQMEVLNLKLTISSVDFSAWQDWTDSYMILGQGGSEVTGTIEFLSPDLRTTLFRYDVQNVGPVSLNLNNSEANVEEISMFTVELQVESVQLR